MRVLLRICLAAAACGVSGLRATEGVVFEDLNGDGARQAGEPGLAGVAVSNGVDIAVTGADGRYTLRDRPGSRVFVIKPRGYQSRRDASNLPRFHAAPGATEVDFHLKAVAETDSLKMLVVTDPQPATPTEVGYVARGIADRIGPRPDCAFGVTLGDIVYDRPDLFAGVNQALSRVGVPWYSLPGNHDLQLGTPDESAAVSAFESVYGPSTYAFHAGPALFVALDDVRPLGGPRYIGGLRPDQFEFLSNLLRITPPSEWIVLMAHIPLFSPYPFGDDTFRKADRQRLFDMIRDRPHVLVLSGHTHYQRHFLHDRDDGWMGAAPLHEYNVAAACGGFWGGPADAYGVPVATMWDGTPPGYALVGFDANTVTLDYVPARVDAQIGLHVPAALRPGQGYVAFYANVYNGHDGWKVEARVDDRAWNALRRSLGWDPTYATAFLAQDSSPRPVPGTRLPDPVVCFHLWRGTLPADLVLGTHRVAVRATDPYGRTFTAEQAFEIARP